MTWYCGLMSHANRDHGNEENNMDKGVSKFFKSLVYPKFSRSPPARPKSGWQVEIRASLVPSSKYVNAAGVGKSHVPTINLLLKVFAE